MKQKRILQFMPWNECEIEFIKVVEVDRERIKSIVILALKRLDFIKVISVNRNNVSFIVENYYEIIKELLVALLLKNGLRSSNHQCLIAFFYKNYQNYEYEANLILQMSYLRNRLNYYGDSIEIEFYDKNKHEFIRIINLLKSIIENKK